MRVPGKLRGYHVSCKRHRPGRIKEISKDQAKIKKTGQSGRFASADVQTLGFLWKPMISWNTQEEEFIRRGTEIVLILIGGLTLHNF